VQHKVFLMIDANKNVVAIYSSKELAEKMKTHIEKQLNVALTVEERSVDIDIKMVGIVK
jgi:hypothetical protein